MCVGGGGNTAYMVSPALTNYSELTDLAQRLSETEDTQDTTKPSAALPFAK